MSVQPIFAHGEVRVKGTHQAFRFVESPFHVYTDFPWMTSVANLERAQGLTGDAPSQSVHAAPIHVFHNQIGHGYLGSGLGNAALPTFNWQAELDSMPLAFRNSMPMGFSEVYLRGSQNTAPQNYVDAFNNLMACQGFTLKWRMEIADFQRQGAVAPFFTARVGIGTGADQRLYSIRFDGTGNCKVSQSDTGGLTWKDIEVRPLSSDVFGQGYFRSEADGAPGAIPDPNQAREMRFDYQVLDVRLLAGRLVFRTGSMDEPYAYFEARIGQANHILWQINHVRVRAYNFVNLAFSCHPMKWETHALFDSIEIPIGFYSENVRVPYIDPAGVVPPGSDAFLSGDPFHTQLFGPIVFYRMHLNNAQSGVYKGRPYSDFTAAVRAVNLIWGAVTRPAAGPDRFALPEVITVRHSFSPEALTIESGASLTLNNTAPTALPTGEFGHWGQWSAQYGQVATQIRLIRTTPAGTTGGWFAQFTGYGHTRGTTEGARGASSFRMECRDRKIQLQQPRWVMPWMDGWNVFYAIAYLAQLGGVHLGDMGFAHLVPDSPFEDWGDEWGGGAYMLPVGSAGSVVTRFSGAPLWDVMMRISSSIGYLLFFDANGMLQFRKFRMPVGIRRVFFESDAESRVWGGTQNAYGGVPGAEGCWTLQTMKTMEDVRNISIVLGIDAFAPRHQPVVMRHFDMASVYDMNAPNHLGYEAPAVWVDNMFAAPGFAERASEAMLRFLRVPGYDVSFTTWLQPDLFPMDVVMVQSVRFGSNNTRVMITEIEHTVTKSGGHSRISGRVVPL